METIVWESELSELTDFFENPNSKFKTGIIMSKEEFLRYMPDLDPVTFGILHKAKYLCISLMSPGRYRYIDGSVSAQIYTMEILLLPHKKVCTGVAYQELVFHIPVDIDHPSSVIYIHGFPRRPTYLTHLLTAHFDTRKFLVEALDFNKRHGVFNLDI